MLFDALPQGARIALDGRNVHVPDFEKGNFVGSVAVACFLLHSTTAVVLGSHA